MLGCWGHIKHSNLLHYSCDSCEAVALHGMVASSQGAGGPPAEWQRAQDLGNWGPSQVKSREKGSSRSPAVLQLLHQRFCPLCTSLQLRHTRGRRLRMQLEQTTDDDGQPSTSQSGIMQSWQGTVSHSALGTTLSPSLTPLTHSMSAAQQAHTGLLVSRPAHLCVRIRRCQPRHPCSSLGLQVRQGTPQPDALPPPGEHLAHGECASAARHAGPGDGTRVQKRALGED